MNPSTSSSNLELSDLIQQQATGLDKAWFEALLQASWDNPLPENLQTLVYKLAEQVVLLLQSETINADQSQAIGRRLAGLNCNYPEALPLTVGMLTVHFSKEVPAQYAKHLGGRVAQLIGYITTGFFQPVPNDNTDTPLPEREAALEPISLTLAHLSRVRLENLKRMQVIELEMMNNQLRQELEERQQAESVLRHYNQGLTKVAQAGHNLASALNVEQVLEAILAELHRLIKVHAYSVWLIDQETGELVCRQAAEAHRYAIVGWRLPVGQGVVGWVAKNNKPIIVSDTRHDQRHFKRIDQVLDIEIRSILSVPLRGRHSVIGVLQIVDSVPNRFHATDSTLIQTLARAAGVAIENAQIYEQTRHDAEVKTSLLQETNHRIQNNLASINSILNLKRDRIQSTNLSDYQAITEDVINQVQSLTTVYNMLAASTSSTLPISELISRVINANLKVLAPQKYVSVDVPVSDIQVNARHAHELALLTNEIVTNAIKHALPYAGEALRLEVDITEQNSITRLVFQDNGPGYPSHLLSPNPDQQYLGLELLQQIATTSLNGSINLANDSGAKIVIEFKLDYPQSEFAGISV